MLASLLIRRNAIKSISNHSILLTSSTPVAVSRADSLLTLNRYFADDAKRAADNQSSRSSIDEKLSKLNQQREKLAREATNEESSANTKSATTTTNNNNNNSVNASQDKSSSATSGDAKQSRPYSKVQWSEPSSRSHVSELIRKGVVDPNATKSKRSTENDSQNRERRQYNNKRDDKSKNASSASNKPQRQRKEEQQFHGISAENLAKIQEQMRKEELEEKEWMPKESNVDLAKYSENDKMLSSSDLVKNIKSDHIQKARRHALDTGSSESQIAAMTARIIHLQQHMKIAKKDNHSRRGLMLLIENRRKQMKYLLKKDREAYDRVVAMFSLRHIAGAKASSKAAEKVDETKP